MLWFYSRKPLWNLDPNWTSRWEDLTEAEPYEAVGDFNAKTFQEQPTLKHDMNWKTWGMFARDQAPQGNSSVNEFMKDEINEFKERMK
jgi:hypothetical protein